jgi:hypothetical protein
MPGITRVNLLYNMPGRPGRLGLGRTAFFQNIVLKSADDPLIPGTDVPRLDLVQLASNVSAAFNDDIDALEEGLKRWRNSKPLAERDAARKRVVRRDDTLSKV